VKRGRENFGHTIHLLSVCHVLSMCMIKKMSMMLAVSGWSCPWCLQGCCGSICSCRRQAERLKDCLWVQLLCPLRHTDTESLDTVSHSPGQRYIGSGEDSRKLALLGCYTTVKDTVTNSRPPKCLWSVGNSHSAPTAPGQAYSPCCTSHVLAPSWQQQPKKAI
jgi:hypothetical protein